ncbi:dehydrogenase [Candidatus Caldarchaeum subterraneum]|uniref:Dehydrogenase n=1 Tax=Caldiarchaeum subterraneum TaxID=311458 RepID=Q4LED8_CALS0|nr:dehydrogenase [Candidatus Caldarchaeum subterraneum]BAJ49007.1 dehydrogenase [Candidatus Caldarchaeum subterraneum]BAJ51584.1 dehydrogenase [Candidatus Caldarchaeum subterraneum]
MGLARVVCFYVGCFGLVWGVWLRAAVFHGPGDLRVMDVGRPSPGRGEVLVRTFVTLTCGTDLKMFLRGHPYARPPVIMGHEFAGVVVEVGEEVDWVNVGDEVVAANSAPCGYCIYCKLGRFNLCENLGETIIGFSVDGAYAEYIKLPRRIVTFNLYKLPKGLEPRVAALLEPLACVVRGQRLIHIDVGDAVAVVGAGPIGLLHMLLSRLSGARKVIVLDVNWNRLRFASELGADIVVNSGEEDARKRVLEETGGIGADVVIEAVGLPETWERALTLVRKGGTVLFFGGPPGGTKLTADTHTIHYGELSLHGSFHHTPQDVVRALRLLESKKLPFEKLITGEARLEDIHRVFEELRQGKHIKVAIKS